MISKKWQNRIAAGTYIFIFIFVFLCNLLTPYIADDFSYTLSFATGQPLRSVVDIIPSMIAHFHTINGRIVAHSIVQVFSMLPNWVFDVANAAVFVLQIILLQKISMVKTRCFPVAIAAFCSMWMFELNFGEVNLWQDGAVNYLWSIPAGCLFLLPYVSAYMENTALVGKRKRILFAVAAFAVGAYSETVSAAAIFAAMLLMGLYWLENKKVDAFLLSCIGIACLGYISIYLAPAQWINKSVSFSLRALMSSALNAVYRYEEIGVLLIPYVILLILNLSEKTDKKRILLSLVFILGSLAANFILIFAVVYHERCAAGAFAFLVAANMVLVPPVLESQRFKALLACTIAVLLLVTLPVMLEGSRDIAVCYLNWKTSERILLEKLDQGEKNIQLPMVYGYSPYCALYDLEYLGEETSEYWINIAMAKYYGAESILGVDTRK